MTERPTPDPADRSVGSGEATSTSTPRWVKVFGIIVLVAIVLLVILVLTGGRGGHGPGRHGADGPRGHTGPPAGVTHDEP